ncbi:EamA family transporter [Candidatus Peregrinibacteria bacterium]|nr:EamA family transporter [Candidatus Peregrinibacteria bacterium]
MSLWFLFSLAALASWSLWAISAKIAALYLPPREAFLMLLLGIVAACLTTLLILGLPKEFHPRGSIAALIAGITLIPGELFFLYALRSGKVSIVVPLTALYPAITVVLAILFLREAITLRQGIGILFAFIAVVMLAL